MKKKTLPFSLTILIWFSFFLIPVSYASTIGGERDTSFNSGNSGPNSSVWTMVEQPDGKVVLGGFFTQYNGVSSNGIVRVNADGLRDSGFSIGSGISMGNVRTLAIQSDGKIIVGGIFSSFNSNTVGNVVRINTDGTFDNTFNVGTGFNDYVWSVKIQPDGKIVLGGDFTFFNGSSTSKVIRLNSDGTKDTTFSGPYINYTVQDLALQQDGKIVAVGNFSSSRILRLNTNGSIDNTYSAYSSGNVYTVKIQSDGKAIFGGGLFNYLNGSTNNFARLNSNSTWDNTFLVGTGANGIVWSTEIQPQGKILVGGDFTSFNGFSSTRLIRLFPDATVDNTFSVGSGFNGFVRSILTLNSGRILIGGQFSQYRGVNTGPLVALYPSFNQISSPDGTLDFIKGETSLKEGSSVGSTSPSELIQIVKTNIPISDVTVDLSTTDRTWNSVTADTSVAAKKSVVSGLATADGVVGGTHALYIPRSLTDSFVVICPDAQTMDQVSGSCSNAQVKVEADLNTEIVDVSGQSYWKVSGLTGTGGISNPGGCMQITGMTLANDLENTASQVDIAIAACSALPAGSKIKLQFPSQWNIGPLNVADVTISTPAMTSTTTKSGNTLEITLDDPLLALDDLVIQIGDGDTTAINPPNSGVYYIGIITTDAQGNELDTGAVDGVIDNANNANVDNVMITAQLFQQCSMDLGSADIIDLGLLVINTDSSGSHNAQVDCNAQTFTISLTDETNGFRNSAGDALGDVTTVTADPTANSLDACLDSDGCFGVTVNGGTQQSGDTDFSCDDSFISSSVYSGLSDSQPITICSATGPVDSAGQTEFFNVAYGARVQPDASAGIYSDLIFYTLTPSF